MKVELQDNSLFKNVGREIFQSDILSRNPQKVNSRIAVFSKGQTVSSLYLLIEGSINLIDFNFLNREKNENKNRVIEAGEFFGYEGIETDKKRTSAAITLTECEIYEITVDELSSLIAQDELIMNNLDPKTEIEVKLRTKKENESYFDFKTKVDIPEDKQTKKRTVFSEIEKLKESLDKKKQIEEKLAKIVDAKNGSETAEVQPKEFRNREEELLERINELEKINKNEEAEAKEKGPVEPRDPKLDKLPVNDGATESENSESDSEEDQNSDDAINLERDYNIAFQVQEYKGVAIVFVNIKRGAADSALRLERILDKLLAKHQKKIVVDLSFCDFLDSTFLGVIVTLLKNLNIEGGSLKVVLNAIKISSSTFFLAGMDKVFNIQTDLTKAIRDMANEDR